MAHSETQSMDHLESEAVPVQLPSERGRETQTSSSLLRPLPPERLYRTADLSALAFETTAEIEGADGLLGQQRALDAIEFGTRINARGFNLFVIGPHGVRPRYAIEQALRDAASERKRPSDWVYVNNFADPRKPVAIELPGGRAGEFRDGMHALIDDLKTALPAVFQSEDYQTRRSAIDQTFQLKQAEGFSALQEKAAAQDIAILRTPDGLCPCPRPRRQASPSGRAPEAARRKAGRSTGNDRRIGKGSRARRTSSSAVGNRAP